MFKLIVLLTLVVNFGCILSNPASPESSFISENVYSSSSSESSSSSFSQSSSSQTYVSNSENTSKSQCNGGSVPGPVIIKPRPPIVKPKPPVVKPKPPVVKPKPPVVKPKPPVVKPKPPVVKPKPPVTTTDPPTTTPSNTSISEGIDEFNKGNAKFTARFFDYVVQKNPGKSVIMSVYSTLSLLALLGYFAIGQTQTQLLTPINFKSKDQIPVIIPAILDMIKEQKNVTLTLVAKTYGNSKSKFSDDYLTESKTIVGATAETLNFDEPEEAAKIINTWVAENTNNKIQNLVPPSLLTPDTEMVLTNAFYFLGEWRNKFDNESTISSKFYKSDNTTVMVDMMNQVKYFKYAEIDNLNAQALELPYVNNNLTCLILLPREIGGAASLVSKLMESDALKSIMNTMDYKNVAVSLPRFKTTTNHDLKDIFQKLGITSMFNAEESQLSGILADPTIRILITAAIQKATVEVTETGSEAAAANAFIGVGITSVGIEPPPPIPFTADRDFVYFFIFGDTPIFCGLYAGN